MLPYLAHPFYQGDVSALMTLGAFYRRGTGVEKDDEKSFNCYKAAADQGTQYWLVILHMINRRSSDFVCIVWYLLAMVLTICRQSLSYSVSHSFSQSVSQSVSQLISHSVNQSIGLSVSQSVCPSMRLSVCLSVSQSVSQ